MIMTVYYSHNQSSIGPVCRTAVRDNDGIGRPGDSGERNHLIGSDDIEATQGHVVQERTGGGGK